MSEMIEKFRKYREEMNEKILNSNNKTIKRVYNADTNCYLEGALPVSTKEMMGLVSSMVLRCDDCVKYHLEKCYEQNISDEEIFEVFQVAVVVGGTIVVPHMRRAVEYWEELKKSI